MKTLDLINLKSAGKAFARLALATAFLVVAPAAYAVDMKTIVSSKGVKALLVEDYTVPLIAISYSFKGGTTQDAPGKEGTAKLLTNTLDEGAGDIKSLAFQEALDDNGMKYSFSAGTDSFSGSVQVLKPDAERSFELLTLMLNKPRFDAEPVGRMKASRLNGLRAEATNPQAIASKALRENLFADHPYSRAANGTIETMEGLTGTDLEDYRKRVFAKDNLVIGVVGAISPDELSKVLDRVFGDLPKKAKLTPVPEWKVATGKKIQIDFETPQTNIRLAYPGLKRDDKDFFAAYLMNYVLGGGSFSSRLYEEVREKRGLAYGVYSYLATYDYSGFTGVGTATRAERANTALEVLRAEVERMAAEGPTAEELDKARRYIKGSYAISNLDTSAKIAGVLVAIQSADLGIDYIDKRDEYLDAVTLEDVKRVAARLLASEPTVITVGKPQG